MHQNEIMIFLQSKSNAPMLDVTTKNSSIEFQDVSFGYNDRNLILNNLSFRVEPGQKIALVGGSGSGLV
jgi:ABC-type multidrug transport system fused ATPase/permease subunit